MDARNLRAVLSATFLLAAGPALASDLAAPTVIDFEEAPSGQPPPGFTPARTGGGPAGVWVVQMENGAPSGTKMLVQTSTDTTRRCFPLCVFDAISTADGTFRVRFKPVSGTVDRAAGLVWRYRDADNYYLVRANALEGNVVLYKVENGKRSDLDPVGSGAFTYGKKTPVETGRWQTLEVKAQGSRFAVSLNGEHLFDVEDATFSAPGKVGLWTKADSVTAFDDLVIEPARAP